MYLTNVAEKKTGLKSWSDNVFALLLFPLPKLIHPLKVKTSFSADLGNL